MNHTGGYQNLSANSARQRFIAICRYHTPLFEDLHRHELPKVMTGLNLLDGLLVEQICNFLEHGTGLSRPFDQSRMDVCTLEICSQIVQRDSQSFAQWFSRMQSNYDVLVDFAKSRGIASSEVIVHINSLDQRNGQEVRPLSATEETTLLRTILETQCRLPAARGKDAISLPLR